MGILEIPIKIPLPADYEVKEGDTIEQIIAVTNTGIFAADDEKVRSDLAKVSNKELEDKIYAQTGAKVEIGERRTTIIKSGWEWEHAVRFEVKKASPVLAIIIGGIILAALILAILIFLDIKTKEVSKIIGIPVIPFIVIGIILIILLSLIRQIFKG